jgi:hypothetical protein
VRPEVLRWARESAGYSEQEAAKRLRLDRWRLEAAEQGHDLGGRGRDPEDRPRHRPAHLELQFFSWQEQPFMPVEFSVAAYRFGHSMIRPTYDLNETVTDVPIFAGKERPENREHLGGFRRLPSFWTIDWSHFVAIDGSTPSRVGVSTLAWPVR